MGVDYTQWGRDPRNAPTLPTFVPANSGGFVKGHCVGDPNGWYVCVVGQTSEAPPAQGGRSNDKWIWSRGQS
jgi:hypothetical protein